MTDEIVQTLQKTLDVLDGGRRWHRGSLLGSGGVCLWGALNTAVCGHAHLGCTDDTMRGTVEEEELRCVWMRRRSSCAYLLEVAIAARYPDVLDHWDRPGCIPMFNDHEQTTWEDVALVLKEAIERAGEEGEDAAG